MAGFYKKRKGKGKGSRTIPWQPIAVLVLMAVSFVAGMWTHSVLNRPLQTDAGLTYIEDIPVITDYIPEGSRARPGGLREIKYLVIHETDNFSAGADAAAHNSFPWTKSQPKKCIISESRRI